MDLNSKSIFGDSKDRVWSVPDAIKHKKILPIYENNHQTNLLAVSLEQGLGEITLADRDEAVRLLKFQKFWFGYPPIVFLTAVSVLDQFLIKMKVQRKYLSCVVVSCLYVAVKLRDFNIDTKSLVALSRSKFSVKDVERMSEIIKSKLKLETENQVVCVFYYLHHFLGLLESLAVYMGIKPVFNTMLKKSSLLTRLEVIMCNSECASSKPVIIVLALIQLEIEKYFSKGKSNDSNYYSIEMWKLLTTVVDLQLMYLITPGEFITCHKKIVQILNDYDNYCKFGNSYRIKSYFLQPSYTNKHYRNYFNMQTIVEEDASISETLVLGN